MAGAVRYVDGVWIDADGNPTSPPPASQWVSPNASKDPFGGYSAGDIGRQEREGTKRALVAGGIGALGSAAQFGLQALPTEQDRYNEKRMGELERHKGLSQGERRDIDEQAMRGVKVMAAENQSRDEALLAGSGSHDVASIERVRRAKDRNLADASIQAADIGIRENRAQVQRDVQEHEERRAYKSNRQRDRIELLGRTLTGLAETMAPVLAAGAVQTAPSDAQFLAMQAARNPDGKPTYPGMQGQSVDTMRTNWGAQYTAARRGRPDSAAQP